MSEECSLHLAHRIIWPWIVPLLSASRVELRRGVADGVAVDVAPASQEARRMRSYSYSLR